jgi:hypothetical protein
MLSVASKLRSPICDLDYNLGFSSQGNFSRLIRTYRRLTALFRKAVRQVVETLQ